MFKENVLALEVVTQLLILLLDRFATSVYLLEENLHYVGLASAQLLHLLQMFVRKSFIYAFWTWIKWRARLLLHAEWAARRRLQRCRRVGKTMHDTVRVLVLAFVEVPLHLTWVECL